MAVRLRYLAHDLEVPPGQFFVGRSVECQLSLDDPLVSRKHALLTVRGGRVMLEDLESRNGVFVNGERIAGQYLLHDGDVLRIGSQELTLHYPQDTIPDGAELASSMRQTTAQIDTPAEPMPAPGFEGRHLTPPPASPGRRMFTSPPATPGRRLPPAPTGGALPASDPTPLVDLSDHDEEATFIHSGSALLPPPSQHPDRRVNQLVLVGGVAEKALALGRAEEAERLLSKTLHEILEKAREGDLPGSDLALRASRLAARLGAASQNGIWIDYVVELYARREDLMPPPIVDELHKSIRRVKSIDLRRLRDYLALLREKSAGYGPADRFLLQRIEGLERLSALK